MFFHSPTIEVGVLSTCKVNYNDFEKQPGNLAELTSAKYPVDEGSLLKTQYSNSSHILYPLAQIPENT